MADSGLLGDSDVSWPDASFADGSPPLDHGSPTPDAAETVDAMVVESAYWALQATTGTPAPRRSSGAALQSQSDRDRLWIFGGFDGSGASLRGDLHVYDTSRREWTAVTPANAPDAREQHALVWHSGANVLVLFGGQKQNSPLSFVDLDDLHFYNPSATSWTSIAKSGSTWPAGRRGSVNVWVPHLGSILLFGGVRGLLTQSRFNDVWLLSLNTGGPSATWTERTPTGTVPPPLDNACAGYDPVARRLIVFGGEIASGEVSSATFQYLLDSNVWQRDTPSGDLPPLRSYAQCAWNPSIQRLMLYGGQDNSGYPKVGAYLYDPDRQSWREMSPPTTPTASTYPDEYSDGGAVFSPALGGMLWFGGRLDYRVYSNETWLMTVR
jgi:hypothetical protein